LAGSTASTTTPASNNNNPLAVRNAFLKAAIVRSQKLPRQLYSTGGEVQFTLPHAGYGIFCILDFDGQIVTTGSGGSQKFSDKAPWNLFDKVSFDDYLGINRISCTGHDLHERLLARKYEFDENNQNLIQAYSNQRLDFSLGGATGAAGTYPLVFSEVVPISLHENTTEGSFPFTIPNGDNVITVNFASETGSTNDSVIKTTTAGFTNTFSGTVGCTYYYWDVPAGTQLPVDDFALVHELRRVKDTSALTAGDEHRYTLRTGRTYYQIIQNLRINDAGDTADVNTIDFYIDGDTSTMTETLVAYLTRMYLKHGRDQEPGIFIWDFWSKPWTPNQYGSLETSLELDSDTDVTGNSYVSIFMESMYTTSKILSDLANMPGGQKS